MPNTTLLVNPMEPPTTTAAAAAPPLHTYKTLRRAAISIPYTAVYMVAVLSLLYYHSLHLFSTSTTFFLLFSDLILALYWASTQCFHLRPIRRREFPHRLGEIMRENDFPRVDIFICTADPYKEPPMGTVNSALSVMAYDYPPEKVSVYLSDDGGSQLALFAFYEAARFARHWMAFCRENNVEERSPEAYFGGNYTASSQAQNIKMMYESMKTRVENAVEKGRVEESYIDTQAMRDAFCKWTNSFSRQHHPPIIQVLLSSSTDRDTTGEPLPNLVYVSREKSKSHHHLFKAGALNTLIRVSAAMTNAPLVLTLDCDTISNDPQTIRRVLCYISDPKLRPTLAYIQFPQIFRGLNKDDIYFCEHKRLFQIHPMGMDGFRGPNYVGTGCFFQRRAFFGTPSYFIEPDLAELSPNHEVVKPIDSEEVLALAHRVATCDFESNTTWGSKIGFRYRSLVEDYYTGYKMQCQGWTSIFCYPGRVAFLGDAPVTLIDLLGQCKRWMIGILQVLFSKYNTFIFGSKNMGLVMGLAYSYYGLWPILSLPICIYGFLPQLALLNGVSIFPKVSDPWFLLYIFLFTGSYAKDLLEYILERGTFQRWWNSQRMWMICGLSSFLFGCIEYSLNSLGISMHTFNVTSKVQDDELNKRYGQGTFEFGVESPMFVPLTMAAILNLVSFFVGLMLVMKNGLVNSEGMILQILLSGFVVVNSWPVYEAALFRSDKGRMPTKTTVISALLVSSLWALSSAINRV